MPKKSEKFRVKMLIAQPTNLNISKANFGFAQELSPDGLVWHNAGGGGDVRNWEQKVAHE